LLPLATGLPSWQRSKLRSRTTTLKRSLYCTYKPLKRVLGTWLLSRKHAAHQHH
jgi:hypothetical protein